MSAKDTSQARPQVECAQACWECVRRAIDCDGGRPVCAKCLEKGIVCPGFENKKPLVWVTPGKVTHRAPQRPSRRKGPARTDVTPPHETISNTVAETVVPAIWTLDIRKKPGATGSSHSDDGSVFGSEVGPNSRDTTLGYKVDAGRKQLTLQHRPSTVLNLRTIFEMRRAFQRGNTVPRNLWVEEYELFDAVAYYISRIYMPRARTFAVQSLHYPAIVDAANIIQGLLKPCRRHAFMAIVAAHHLFSLSKLRVCDANNTEVETASLAATKFHRHIGFAIQALQMELSSTKGASEVAMLTDIWELLSAEASQGLFYATEAHINGLLTMIESLGGLGNVISLRAPNLSSLQAMVMSCVFTYTTSPADHSTIRASQMGFVDLHNLYNWTAIPDLLCPAHLFLDIVRINLLRFERASDPSIMTHDNWGQSVFTDILQDIWSFDPKSWAQTSGHRYEDQVIIIGRMFQCLAALYAIMSLQDGTHASGHASRNNVHSLPSKSETRSLLFELIELALNSEYIETMAWPLAVAGAAATVPSQRTAVLEGIQKASNYIGFFTSLNSLKEVLEEHWVSGKTGWDNCFYRPYFNI